MATPRPAAGGATHGEKGRQRSNGRPVQKRRPQAAAHRTETETGQARRAGQRSGHTRQPPLGRPGPPPLPLAGYPPRRPSVPTRRPPPTRLHPPAAVPVAAAAVAAGGGAANAAARRVPRPPSMAGTAGRVGAGGDGQRRRAAGGRALPERRRWPREGRLRRDAAGGGGARRAGRRGWRARQPRGDPADAAGRPLHRGALHKDGIGLRWGIGQLRKQTPS